VLRSRLRRRTRGSPVTSPRCRPRWHRELFDNPGVGGGSWATENAMLLAVGWPVLLMLIFAPLAVRRYRNRSI